MDQLRCQVPECTNIENNSFSHLCSHHIDIEILAGRLKKALAHYGQSKKHKYYLPDEFDLGSDDRPYFVSMTLHDFYGDTYEEVIEHAFVAYTDQDGGDLNTELAVDVLDMDKYLELADGYYNIESILNDFIKKYKNLT